MAHVVGNVANSIRRSKAGVLNRHSVRLRGLAIAAMLLAGLAVSLDVKAAAADAHHPMRFDRVSLEDGLSQSNVFAVLQDSRGLMWFGTENGLNRYDGYEFEVYKRDRGNTDTLLNDYIYDIAEDAAGRLWVATNGGGLALMDRNQVFTSFRHDPANDLSVASNRIRKLLVDVDGSLWLGTRGQGVDRFDPETGTAENFTFGEVTDPSRNVNEVYALYRDGEGFLWIGTNDGLVRLDPASGAFERFGHAEGEANGLSGPRVRSIVEDSTGALWIGTYGSGLNRYDRDTGSFEAFRHDNGNPASLPGDRVPAIYEDRAGRLWVGTDAGLGMFKRSTSTFASVRNDRSDPMSLGGNEVTTITEDRSGILWVATRGNGLSKWNPRSWALGYETATELSESGESQPNVTSFVEDPAGVLWIGTFGDGLHAVDRNSGETRHYRKDPANPNAINDNRVMSLMQDSSGSIWIGTMRGGLNRLDPATGEFAEFRHDAGDPASIAADGVMAIFEDSGGNVWAGTYGGGANRFDRETESFTRFMPVDGDPASISSTRVRAFAEDPTGKIWMATDAGGLNLFDPATERFTHFRHDPFDPATLADDTIYALDVAADGTLWIGTQGGGLDRVVGSAANPDEIRFENISQSDGLSNDVIYGLEVDTNGTIWVSTAYGISRYNPATGEIRNMHRQDGLQSEEFHSGAHYQSAGGELFFGGPNGYNAFHPDEFATASVVPLLMLTGVFSGNDPIRADEPIDENEGLTLDYKQDNVSFEFAALDYTASERNQYRYKLEGFDKEWIELGNRRRITYTDLDDGNYLLRVQAANADGVWNTEGLSIPLRVSPAPWDTWWAYLGYLAAAVQLCAFVWLAHRRKIQREEEYSNRLEQEVRQRTEDLIESNRKLKELNHTLQESTLSDPLTGLRNRRFVFEEVSRDIDVIRRKLARRDEGVSDQDVSEMVFMMIDLDHFKPINDTYGHAAGDQILLEVRDVLLGACRSSDFVIRWGGDEFVVIGKQASAGEAERLAERIRSRIAERSFMLDEGQIVRTTCSIGFAAYPLFRGQAEHGSIDDVLMLADSLMYEAKQHRNAWAGMLTPTEASTSFDFDHDSIEPTSMLFRAKRVGKLVSHDRAGQGEQATAPESASA